MTGKRCVIIDKRIPQKAKLELIKYGYLIEMETKGLVYPSISGHPDVFFCNINGKLIVAPNLPDKYLKLLMLNKVDFILGEKAVGSKYPETAIYNAVFSEGKLIHNFRYTDSNITKAAVDDELIHINQGYARCNLQALGQGCFITSDAGIAKTLSRYDLKVFFSSPKNILLPGHKHGFIGGCCGVDNNRIFILGRLDTLNNGQEMKMFIENCNLELIELYDGPLYDGGSILFC